ncbi:MAG TPA: hypothetical protein PKW80_11795 [Bacteroidales bacterium]|nr:hypothetical protein [Bacteroidales bacterium]
MSGTIFILIIFILGVVVLIFMIKVMRQEKYEIMQVKDKYIPLVESGKYLYREEKSGILKAGVGDKYIMCETRDLAKSIIDEYNKQKK